MENFSVTQIEEFNRLFAKATHAHEQGCLAEAGRYYQQLIRIFPEAPLLHYNLGLVFFAQKKYRAGLGCFEKATHYQPEDHDTWYNMGLCQQKLGRLTAAVSSYQRSLELVPGSVDGLYNMGNCFREMHQFNEAMACYQQVLQINPDHSSANNNLAYVYHREGLTEPAIACYRKVLAANPEHRAAAHMLAALQGEEVDETPVEYVREVFDSFSEYFEQSLVNNLGYKVPEKLRSLLDRWDSERVYSHALDLGCGTGLSGEAFQDVAVKFTGVDLSPNMLAVAQKKKIYHELHDREIISYLEESPNTYELVIAADVFGYVGDLKDLFSLVRERIVENGRYCFSTEKTLAEKYRLQENGRFAHSPGYVAELAEETGWQIAARSPSVLRHEKGDPVPGDLWLLTPED